MPTPSERLILLLEVHDDSLRSAAERCGLDHTPLMRVKNGDTENPATLAKIAEGYGVPGSWMRGERDLATDFIFSVLSRPLSERVLFLWEPNRRVSFALAFLSRYEPEQYTISHLAGILQLPQSGVEGLLKGEPRALGNQALERLNAETALPLDWFHTGLVGREDERELLVGLAEWALSSLARELGVEISPEEIQEAALALV